MTRLTIVAAIGVLSATMLNSTERNNLLEPAAAFTDEYHIRIVRMGFDQWFEVGVAGASSPPAWKQNMIVLLIPPTAILWIVIDDGGNFIVGRNLEEIRAELVIVAEAHADNFVGDARFLQIDGNLLPIRRRPVV